MSIRRIIFEAFYLLTLCCVGLYSGYYLSVLAIEGLNKAAGYMFTVFHDTMMSDER